MTGGPNSARAIGGFNLTAQPIGFLQPLFAGSYGDNQTYIQRLDGMTKIAGFEPVAWPERDTVLFEKPAVGTIQQESLWSFVFPNEPPLILPWTQFRDSLRERLEGGVFTGHPLLQFDVVQTLDLTENKPTVFSQAFHAYEKYGVDVAERWRDRAILEPALVEALQSAGTFSANSQPSLRARLTDGIARIEIADFDPSAVGLLEQVYRDIAARYESIFPKVQRVDVLPKSIRQGSPTREGKPVTVILAGKLIGKLAESEFETFFSHKDKIEVINANHLPIHLRRNGPSPLFVVVGRQSDWRELVETGNSIKHLHSLTVVLSAAIEPLASDLDLQQDLQIPSVLMFSLDSGSIRNVLRTLVPLIDIFSLTSRRSHVSFEGVERMPSRHCVLLREEIQPNSEAIETACKIGARAIRAGAQPGTRIDLFVDEAYSGDEHTDWGLIFERLFAVPYPSETSLPKRGRQYLSLLADRSILESKSRSTSIQEGVVRLLRMRGWHVERSDRRLDIFVENRKFSAVVVDRKDDIPSEDHALARPSFGRSHLLVIHQSPSRETLLIGNRGQYSHITLEDISLMRSDTQWIWPILRRQLDYRSARTSLAALRIVSSLAAEAIHMDRVEFPSAQRGELSQLVSLLQADDCERFVDLVSRSRPDKGFRLRIRMGDPVGKIPADPELNLRIEDSGPIVTFDWS